VTDFIRNRRELLSHGAVALRSVALDIANAALAALDPYPAARRIISLREKALTVGGRLYRLDEDTRVFVIGAGKATFPIAKALDEVLGSRIHKGLVICKRGQEGALQHIDLAWASHPIPDVSSLEAATLTKELLANVRSGDIVFSCFTGGSSALFVAPQESITLDEKARTNRALLASGAAIQEINAVRKHISSVKGGRLVRDLPAGTRLINLTVSDVVGDSLDCITDPSVPDHSSFLDAQRTLDKYRLWTRLPEAVVKLLRSAPLSAETCREASLSHLDRLDLLLIRNDAACLAAAVAAQVKGITPVLLSTLFDGESREMGRFMAAIAKQICITGHPVPSPCVLVGGGEGTVTVHDEFGQGGPNQEFGVSFAQETKELGNVVALALDTDGTDGPTAVAGAMVDSSTAQRAERAGIDLHESLRRHDVTPVLRKLDDAIVTGATGTNVSDLRLVLIS